MKYILIIVGLLASMFFLHPQGTMPALPVIGENTTTFMPRYRYSEFRSGQVLYGVDRLSDIHLFNYDRLSGEMRLIGEKGDTLSMGNEKAFRYVIIGDDYFYHDFVKGYIEIVSTVDSVRFGMHERLITMPNPRNTKYYHPEPENIMIENTDFLLIDRNDRVHKLTRSRLLSYFPQYKKSLRKYSRKEHLDFRSRKDVTQLFAYCQELTGK